MLQTIALLADLPRTANRSASLLLALLSNRVELFSLELKEERLRLTSLLIWSGAALLLGLLGLVLASLAAVYAVPPPYRWAVAAGCSLAFILAAIISLWLVRRRLAKAEPPFARTLAELKKDQLML